MVPRMRRLVALVLAAVVGLGGVLVLPAGPAGAAEGDGSDVSVARYGGPDRYSTSLLIAEAVAADAGGSLESVVLVSGERWTDAVVAAPIAGALGAPVLMTPPGELRADALEFLGRVGASAAVVIGPEAGGGSHGPGRGVSAAVLDALAEAGVSADRVAGSDRYSTGVAAAGQVTPGVMPSLGRTAIIASGEVFADALVAGPFAARGIHPVLLSAPDALPADVASYLGTAGIEHVVVMGGTAALSESVESAIRGLGVEVTRLAGTTRYDTAVKAAELVADRYSTAAGRACFTTGTIGVARARVPFDSFSAAPLLGRLCAPLVLADPQQVPADTAAFLDVARDANAALDLRVFGGNAAVSQDAIDTYLVGEGADADEAPVDTGDDTSQAVRAALPAGTCGGSIDDEPHKLVSSQTEDAAWSPDCSRIVYSASGSLWTMRNDGSRRSRLLRYDGGYLHEPKWSPDGSRIVFARQIQLETHWQSHIWMANADGTAKKQLTTGDVWDDSPSWSPDIDRIVFRRTAADGTGDIFARTDADSYLALVGASGGGVTALTAGGGWDHTPAWSPDGRRIAYVSGSAVWLVNPDGTAAERAVAGAFWEGGLSWSPDGQRLAIVRGDRTQSSMVTVDIGGANEETVADFSGQNVSPSWSPDGERLLFTRIQRDDARRVYVSGASGEPDDAAADCMPRGLNGTTAGFPISDWAAPSAGTLRLAVLFVDFADAQASHTTHEEAARGLPYMEQYLETVSYGQLDVEVIAHHDWLRAAKPAAAYLGDSVLGGKDIHGLISVHSVRLADEAVDFSDIDAVMTVLPSTHFGAGNAGGMVEADGSTMLMSRINTDRHTESVELADAHKWGPAAAHELMHNLGLSDLYPYDDSVHERPAATRGHEWVGVQWGLMDLWAWYLAPEDDQQRRLLWRFPNGGTTTSSQTHLNPEEMLAWSRWQLGWLDESQVRCLSDADTIVTLTPIAQPDSGIAMAAVQLNAREVIVIESRRKLGYDQGADYTAPNGGRTTIPNLIEEGVLVYTVDAFVDTGQLPLRIAGDEGNGQVDDFPVLGVGESVTVAGYTITVTADDGNTHTVTMTRSG